jgi:uncharacterized UPF0160 family protein
MKIPGVSFFKSKKLIVTHNGGFHSDDVFAAATLALYFEKLDQPFIIRRSREQEDIEKADIVFDVGMEYDAEKGRFDHHQPGGAGERENGIPYAAFGLVWKHYGLELVEDEEVFQRVDDQLAAPIDGPDNGFAIDKVLVEGIKPFYLGDVLTLLFGKGDDYDKAFADAVQFAKKILSEFIERAKIGAEIKKEILDAYAQVEDKRIAVLDFKTSRQAVWAALEGEKEVLYSVFQSRSDDDWNVVAMRNDLTKFENKKDMPREWSGLQAEELQKVSGVPDAIFCHKSLFLASAKSKEGAIALAKLALKN